MSPHYTKALSFRAAMKQPLKSSNASVWQMQQHLIAEEYKEFITESRLAIHMQTRSDCTFSGTEWRNHHAATLKELADLVFVCYQYAAAMGWDLDQALDRVWASNMSKLGDNGEPIYREDGKVLKGPNYKPPLLDDLVRYGP